MANIRSLVNGDDGDIALSVPDGLNLTYRRLSGLVDQASGELLNAGVEPGTRVALAFPNSPEAVVLFLAAASIGTACPLNPAYTETEFRFYLEDTGAAFLVLAPNDGAAARKALTPATGLLEAEIDARGLRLKTVAARGRDDVSASGAQAIAERTWTTILRSSCTPAGPQAVPSGSRFDIAT